MVNELSIVYAIAIASFIPPTTLIVEKFMRRRLWLVGTAGIGALSSLAVFLLVFASPWIYLENYGVTLWELWRVLKIVGDVFSRSIALTAIFSALGATLWLAEIGGGKEVFIASSSIGFTMCIAYIASTTALAILGTVPAERIGIGAYTSTALFTLNIILSIISRKPTTPRDKNTVPTTYVHRESGDNEIIKRIIEEAKKAIS
jgi:MFS family permease